jgi:anti-sigma regulatory factor (Ser/Thr protein kinase)
MAARRQKEESEEAAEEVEKDMRQLAPPTTVPRVVTATTTLPGTAASVRAARRFVASSLRGLPAGIVNSAVVMASELATNCVQHARTEFTVAVEQCEGEVRVDIADAGAGVPTIRRPENSEPRGRGLLVVERLSDTWGVTDGADTHGKTIWFSLRLPVPHTVS